MTVEVLAKTLAVLKKDLKLVSDEIKAGQEELAELDRKRDNARADLKNIQTLKDPLVANYQLRVDQKKKELVTLEADIKAAQLTREDMDEGMAERLATGQQAIANAQKVERDVGISIRNLKDIEASCLQDIANTKRSLEAEQAILSSLKESVVSLKQDQDRLVSWLRDKEVLIRIQETLERQEQELNAGRDHLKSWEKGLSIRERDTEVMKERLTPQYLAAFKRINTRFTHEGSYTKRKGI